MSKINNNNKKKPTKKVPKKCQNDQRPKYDYDSEDFYRAVHECALQGMTNVEIAICGLKEKLGITLAEPVFSTMINGCYSGWNEEENKRRGERLSKVLAHARHNINAIVRGRYLKLALGGIKVTSSTKRKMRMGGEETPAEEIQTTETELPPNLQALSTWLHHHDPDWRSSDARDGEGLPQLDIDEEAWLLSNTTPTTPDKSDATD